MRAALRLLFAVLLCGILTFPLAVAWAVNRSEVHELVGITPTTFSLTTSGRSELRLGVAGTVFLPISRGPLGVVATVDGPGDPDIGNGDLASYATPGMLSLYAGLFHDPEPALTQYVDQLGDEFQQRLVLAIGILAGLGGLAAFALSYVVPVRRAPDDAAWRIRMAGAMAFVLVCTSGIAVLQMWPANEDDQGEGVYALPVLDGTVAEGSTTNSPVLRTLLLDAAPRVRTLIDRQEASEENFRTLAAAGLTAQADNLVGPNPGEVAVLMQSDMHCNTSMIRLQRQVVSMLKEKFGPDVPAMMAISGDLTTNGTAAEANCVQSIANIAEGAPIAAVTGNHESELSVAQMRDAGMTVLDGTEIELAGVSVLGEGDPSRSELFGQTRPRGDLDQADVGTNLFDEATAARPDLVLVHEAYAAQAFLDVGNMRTFLDERGSATTPYDDGIRDLPAGAIFYGHWHRDVEPRVVWNSDGTWTLVMELGTSGGAIASPTFTHFSTPWSQPQQVATFPVVFLNEETRLVTGYQLYRFDPDGTVSVEPRVDIGTPSVAGGSA